MNHFQTIFPNANISTFWCCLISTTTMNLETTAHHPNANHPKTHFWLWSSQYIPIPCSHTCFPFLSLLYPIHHTQDTHLLTLSSSSTNSSFSLQDRLPRCKEHHSVVVWMFSFLLQCKANHCFKRCFSQGKFLSVFRDSSFYTNKIIGSSNLGK